MVLYLVRHAKAETGHPQGDAARRLSEKGVRRLKTLVAPLKQLGVRPHRHLSSPLVRARQTAQILMDELNWEGPLLESTNVLPDSEPEDFVRELTEHQDAPSLVVYTHNPFVQRLGYHLLDPSTMRQELVFHTPTVLALQIDPPFSPHTGKFLWILHHRDD